jgi:hypothetical protein
MSDDLRQCWRFAASLTVLGLMADLGLIAVEAAVRFSIAHRWAEAAAFTLAGVACTAVAVAGALTRAEREVGRG